jgi:hypothetical protein
MPFSTAAVSAGRFLFLQILFLFFCFTGSPVLAGETRPSPAENLRHLQAARAGRSVYEPDSTFDEDFVRKPVRAMLTRAKHDMRDQIVAAMSQDPEIGARPDAIQAAIKRRFGQAGLKERRGDDLLRYASRFGAHVSEVPEHPELMAVTLSIEIPLGDDTSLYVFARGPSGWDMVLASEVNGYASTTRAQSRFRYKISPSADDGNWFVVTGSITNHAASAWQAVTYTAQMRGADPEHPRIMVQKSRSIYVGGFEEETDAFQLIPSANGFRISFPQEFTSGGVGTVWAVYSYDIAEGRARPHAPECHLNRLRGRRIPCP